MTPTIRNDSEIVPMSAHKDFKRQMPHYLDRIELALKGYLPAPTSEPSRLYTAMRYAVLDGGKRIRPLLVYATGEMLSVEAAYLDAAAAAVELIHVYSLVHDDLPGMDNDDLRRNKPTVHKAYDEATAILVGDALQALAFEILASVPFPEHSEATKQRAHAIILLAQAAGARGMVAGQALDMAAEQQQLNQQQIELMFKLKTGALLRAAILLPIYGDRRIDPEAVQHLDNFSQAIGLAFQIRDDIIDVEGDTALIGKPQGSDLERAKASYPAMLGLTEAKKQAENLYNQALAHLDFFGAKSDSLRFMADFIVHRQF